MIRDTKSGGQHRPHQKKPLEAPALKQRPSKPAKSNVMFPPAKKVAAKKVTAAKKTVAKKATKKKAKKEVSNA
jgi:hypothetical protein|tara:strand:- start:238 stop:456 length:219 start_codon:yes stop_codon:yes gene_type:complete